MEKVRDESWDFKGSDTKYLTHGIHTYPAMMIPQIASRLIDAYLKDGKTILDPFCGSGTVLVESMIRNKKSFGIDINPLAILLSKVKTTPIEPKELYNVHKKLIDRINSDWWEYQNKKPSLNPPTFKNIEFWFKPNVIKKLTIIKNAISGFKNEDIHNFLLAVFSETVREVSNRRSGEFKLYRIPEKTLKTYDPDVFGNFKTNLEEAISKMKEFYKYYGNDKPTVLDEDTRTKMSIEPETIDLLVTSPPYGDSRTTVAYGQFSRLSLEWLGIDGNRSKDIDKTSLGGIRPNKMEININSRIFFDTLEKIRKLDEKRAKDVYSFFVDLEKCFSQFSTLMKPGGHVCMVLGNRTVKGIRIPTDEIIVDFGKEYGMKHIKTIMRNIPSKRMPLENSPSNIAGKKGRTMNEEFIVILKKI